jgi:hypothetical protein
MKDLLKIFIQQNRDAFDVATPGPQGWSGMEKTLERLPAADDLERYILANRLLMDTSIPSEMVWTRIEQCHHTEAGTDVEDFICQNRAALDTEIPDLRIWSNITAALQSPKAATIRVSWGRHLLRVAASVALLVLGLGAGIWYARSTEPAGMAMADVSAEYAELEQYYKHDITDKEAKLASFTGSQSSEVLQDLDQLDRIMEELRHELANVPPGNRQQVVRAMIENYKAKTAILQRVLEHLNDRQNENNHTRLSNESKNM